MKISNEKIEKVSEQILTFLYSNNPKSIFTSHIAKEIARDENFTKKILVLLKEKNIVKEIKKNPKGVDYIRRSKWSLSNSAYKIYKDHQKTFFN